jgi:glycosyltransferase involved in cell wall biosynthesis
MKESKSTSAFISEFGHYVLAFDATDNFYFMKKRLYILAPYPKHQAPSQRFRFEQYIQHIEDSNFTVEFYPFYSYDAWQTLYRKKAFVAKSFAVIGSFIKRLGLFFHLHRADAVLIHREVTHIGPPVLEWLIAKVWRKKYIYDFDDAIWMPNFSESNKRFHWLKAYWKVNYCMKWAKVVSAGNDYLADYARKFNDNVYVIPTTIDTVNMHTKLSDHSLEKVIIGWTGTHTTQKYLNELIPILVELNTIHSFEFQVISNQAPDFELPNLHWIKWNKATEIDDLSRFHIGIMPLINDQWADGKCGFKALQYMALEIATIASPVGVNTQIIHDGVNGFLADGIDEWRIHLNELLTNPIKRSNVGQAGRVTVEQHYSVSALREKYISLINQLTQ